MQQEQENQLARQPCSPFFSQSYPMESSRGSKQTHTQPRREEKETGDRA